MYLCLYCAADFVAKAVANGESLDGITYEASGRYARYLILRCTNCGNVVKIEDEPKAENLILRAQLAESRRYLDAANAEAVGWATDWYKHRAITDEAIQVAWRLWLRSDVHADSRDFFQAKAEEWRARFFKVLNTATDAVTAPRCCGDAGDCAGCK